MMNIKTEDLKSQLNQLLQTEKELGVEYDDFMALMNICKEFLPLDHTSSTDIEKIWMQYRLNNLEQNEYRFQPELFTGFDEIIGQEHILECIKNKGVFGTFHYGAYRYVALELIKLVKEHSSSLDVVVDTDSYESEKDLHKWNEIRKKADVNYIISEEHGSGLKLVRILKNRGNILLYLDGNTGSGEDSQPMFCDHITSSVNMRSGIYRLVSLLKKELCVILADQPQPGYNRLIAYKPFAVSKSNIKEGVDQSYEFFRESLLHRPDLWRFWYRHHHYVENWQEIATNQDLATPNIDWVEAEYGLGIDLRTGHMYETKTS